MGEIPEDVSGAAGSRGNLMGGLAGVGTGLVALGMVTVNWTVGVICCCCNITGITEVISLALVVGASAAAAMSVDWSRVPGDDALGFGAKLGARVGVIAGLLGGILGFLAKLIGSLLSSLYNAYASGQDLMDALMAGMATLALLAAGSAVIGVIFAIASTIFGAGTGAAVGMMKKQA